jgi:hypothetical protein
MTQRYLDGLRSKLRRLYLLEEGEGQKRLALQNNLTGYLDAAIAAELYTKEELQKIIHDVHLEVYGKTVSERRLEKADPTSDELDWSYFEQPTWQRLTE